MSESRFFENRLKPIKLTVEGLLRAQQILHDAISLSVQILKRHVESSSTKDDNHDSLYVGNSGIALAFLRISIQYKDAGLDAKFGNEFQFQMASIISSLLPPLRTHHIDAGHLSPLHSVVGPASIYALSSLNFPSVAIDRKLPPNQTSEDDDTWVIAIGTMNKALRVAVEDDTLGGDEILYGRAGLLWSILNLHQWLDGGIEVPSNRKNDIAKIADDVSVKELVDKIIEAGKAGAKVYAREVGEDNYKFPLMWKWHGNYYLGAIHGTAGVLTVLLQAPRGIITPHLDILTATISSLCKLTVQNNGHLPSSLPVKSRSYNLVQICHGAPGLLPLLAVVKDHYPRIWKREWDEAEALATEVIWREGILKKGISICHGLSGNAWTLLLLSQIQKDPIEADKCLSRALAILVFSTQLPPLCQQGVPSPFRTPDRPFSLFEGLAGAVCAWVEACVIIQNRLKQLRAKGSSDQAEATSSTLLGIPGVGGAGVKGIL